AAIAAIGAAQRLEFLAMHRRAAVTAGTRPRMDDDAVDKPGHRVSLHAFSGRNLRFAELVREPSCKTSISTELGLRGGRPDDAYGLAAVLDAVFDRAGGLGEQGVVAAASDVDARVELGATLADQDLAGLDDLAAEPLDPQPLSGGIATVARAGSALFVCHICGLRSVLSVLRLT